MAEEEERPTHVALSAPSKIATLSTADDTERMILVLGAVLRCH